MSRRLRKNGPIVLVPLAWSFATAAHLGLVTTFSLTMMHLVIDVFCVGFVALSWSEMRTGVLRAWKLVLIVGLVFTLSGTVGLLAGATSELLLGIAVVGWMVAPAVALLYTGQNVSEAPSVYLVGGVVSLLGAAVYVTAILGGVGGVAVVVGLTLVNVGQTAGIVNAVVQY